jgi:hypothetical protein
MIKVDTLRGADIMRLPATIAHTVAAFEDLQEVEVWRTELPRSGLFEYRVFKLDQKLPCIRICLSECGL